VEGRALPAGGAGGGHQGEHVVASLPVTVTPSDSVRVLGRPLRRLSGRAANPSADEPDALKGQVRICGRRRG